MSDRDVERAQKERDKARQIVKTLEAKLKDADSASVAREAMIDELQEERKADLEKIKRVATAESRASAAEHSARDLETKLNQERQKKGAMDAKLKKRVAELEKITVEQGRKMVLMAGVAADGDDSSVVSGLKAELEKMTISRDQCRDNMYIARRETGAVRDQRDTARQERDRARKIIDVANGTIARMKRERAEQADLKKEAASTDKAT